MRVGIFGSIDEFYNVVSSYYAPHTHVPRYYCSYIMCTYNLQMSSNETTTSHLNVLSAHMYAAALPGPAAHAPLSPPHIAQFDSIV